MAHAHKHRVIHCDLKSHNVIVTGDGRAKVLDFGVARRLPPDEIDALTTRAAMPEGSTGGTLAVMAPEVLAGSPPDARSDIWSLGVLLYEMASGQLPFTGATGFALTAAILQQEPPTLPESTPASVRRAIAACLVKDPAARCQHAGEIRAMLENTAPAAGAHTASSRRSGPRLGLAAVLVVLALLAAAVVVYWDRLRSPAGGPVESLAVLPLQNLSGDTDQEYFVDGMTDALITELAQISQLRVISRTSVMQFKDARQPLPEIGRALNVDAIVEGSIRRSGDRVAISVQLLRASSDAHIWAETYEEELRDVLALQRKVARAIADRVRSRIASPASQALARADTLDPKAYEAYVRGRFFWNRRTSDSLRTAIQYFNQALKHDPAYAPAYSGLADSHFYLGYVFGREPPREAMPRARQAADTALRLDPNVGEAHTSAGLISMIYDWDRPAAERSFKQAIALNRSYATAYHGYAALLASWGDRGDGAVAMIRGLETDPLSMPVNHMAGLVLSLAGRSDDAIAQLGRTLEMEPGHGLSRGVLASEYERRGKYAEAFAELQWLKQQAGADADLLKRFEETYTRGGIVAYRELDLKRAIENWDGWHASAWEVALLCARLGHAERAFDWLDRAVEMRSGMVVWLPTAPEFAHLRAHPRYQAVVRRIAAPPS